MATLRMPTLGGTSNTLASDRKDHPIAFALVNIPMWFTTLIFVAIPFSLVASLMCIFVRMFAIMFRSSNMTDLGDFLEVCQLMPEICVAGIIDNNDFCTFLDWRVGRGTIQAL